MTEREIKLLEALRETAQTLSWISFGECRGISENLLTPKEAVDLAKYAIASAEDDSQPDEVQRAIEAEREACIKICSELASDLFNPDRNGAIDCLKAILARSNKQER